MDIITIKLNFTLPALLPNKFNMTMQGPATSSENIRSKRAIPALAIIQGIAAIARMMINAVVCLFKNFSPIITNKRYLMVRLLEFVFLAV